MAPDALTTSAPPLTPEQRDAVLVALEQQLVENEGNRLTLALRIGIVTVLQRTVPVAPPAVAVPGPAADPAPAMLDALGVRTVQPGDGAAGPSGTG